MLVQVSDPDLYRRRIDHYVDQGFPGYTARTLAFFDVGPGLQDQQVTIVDNHVYAKERNRLLRSARYLRAHNLPTMLRKTRLDMIVLRQRRGKTMSGLGLRRLPYK